MWQTVFLWSHDTIVELPTKRRKLGNRKGKNPAGYLKEKNIGFHFSLVKTRRIKLVSNILFPEVQVSMAPCERKKKISTFFTSLFQIE